MFFFVLCSIIAIGEKTSNLNQEQKIYIKICIILILFQLFLKFTSFCSSTFKIQKLIHKMDRYDDDDHCDNKVYSRTLSAVLRLLLIVFFKRISILKWKKTKSDSNFQVFAVGRLGLSCYWLQFWHHSIDSQRFLCIHLCCISCHYNNCICCFFNHISNESVWFYHHFNGNFLYQNF